MMMIPSVAATLVVGSLAFYYTRAPSSDDGGPQLNATLTAATAAGAAAEDEEPTASVSESYDLSSHQTLSRVILLIRENYVEPERIKSYDMFLAALDYIQRSVPEVMIDESQAPERIKVSVGTDEQTFELGGLDQLWEVTMALRDIFRFLQAHLADPEQRREVEYAAINGMLSTLDPHSVLLPPQSFDEVKMSTKGEFGGLGIVISIRDGALTVISPIEGTPAARAGLHAKDKITKIGEESTINMNLDEAVQRLRGKPGTKVSIWVLRKGWTEARRYTLTRAIIKIESVSSELLADSIGYIKIKSFQNNTYDDLHEALEALRKKNKGELKGLVLDLRNNPGGLLDQAILVSDRFIDSGPIVITVGEGNRKREEKTAHAAGTERNYPIALLVNGGSASASEIVAGALKNTDRAIVIGQQSFGKGSVQVLYDFKDKSALKLTIAQYLTPGDVSIQSVGISPDVEIVPATIAKDGLRLFVDDDSPHEKDLEKHLDRRSANAPSTAAPQAHIVHLAADPPPPPPEGEEPAAAEGAESFSYDFETRLAHDVLAAATSLKRPEVLAAATQLFQARAEEEERRIEQRFKDLGIDWSKAEGVEPVDQVAHVSLAINNKGKTAIRAGDTITLTVTARNTGAAPLYRVYGVSNSDNPLLKNLEFAFGKLAAGESRSWSVDVKLPDEMTTRADTVTVKLANESGKLNTTSPATLVSIEEAHKPRFAYNLRIDDRTKGNGDGVLQQGEKVDVFIDVKNVGDGEAKDAVVTLKNLAGEAVFLERGREKLGAMKPGASKATDLKFSVRDAVTASELELRIAIWDNTFGAAVTESFKLPVAPPRQPVSEPKMVKVQGKDPQSKEPVTIYAGAATSTAILGYAANGAMLKSDARFEPDWRRIELPNGGYGFVAEKELRVTKNAVRTTPKQSVTLLADQAAPVITLSQAALVTSESVLRLRASLTDERTIKDAYIFVDDKKVFYQAFGPKEGAVPGAPVTVPLEVAVPLKDGANTVMLIVRESDDLVARKILGVFRAPAAAVAEIMTTGAAAAVGAAPGTMPDPTVH